MQEKKINDSIEMLLLVLTTHSQTQLPHSNACFVYEIAEVAEC